MTVEKMKVIELRQKYPNWENNPKYWKEFRKLIKDKKRIVVETDEKFLNFFLDIKKLFRIFVKQNKDKSS